MKKVNVFKYTGIFIGVLIITFVVMTYVSEYIYSMIGARVNFSLSFIVIEFVKFGIIYDLFINYTNMYLHVQEIC